MHRSASDGAPLIKGLFMQKIKSFTPTNEMFLDVRKLTLTHSVDWFQYPLVGPSATPIATYLRLHIPRLLLDLLELVLYVNTLVQEGLGK